MTTLVLGGSGATGRWLVRQLLERGVHVRVIVRSAASLPSDLPNSKNLTVVEASVLDLTEAELRDQVAGCDAIASCLGHRLSFRGMFGKPRRLVTEAVRRSCAAIRAEHPSAPVKFVLMNTTGVRNRDLAEKISFPQKCVIFLLRLLLPPHADNEEAADFLRTQVGSDDAQIEWAAVRPDGLTSEEEVTAIDVHPSPTRSAIFDAGKTSRINVAHFMAELITDEELWSRWKGRMPVVYNRAEQGMG